MLLLFFQKAISFLKARKSNIEWRAETMTVTPSNKGLVSRNIRFISSISSSPFTKKQQGGEEDDDDEKEEKRGGGGEKKKRKLARSLFYNSIIPCTRH